jgi:hypothetical protein
MLQAQTEITSCTESAERPLQIGGYAYPTSTWTFGDITATTAPFWTVGVFAVLLFAGTGGSVSEVSTTAVEKVDSARTGSNCSIEYVSKSRRQDEEDENIASTEGLPVLQHYLSLNLSDLAAILRVSRPTIYSWLKEDSSPQAHNTSRMRQLFRLAKLWSDISRKPLGSHLKTPVVDGQSVFDLLSQDHLDRELIRSALMSCSLMLEQDLARPRPRSAAEIAKLYGLQSQSKNSQEESVAQETGL